MLLISGEFVIKTPLFFVFCSTFCVFFLKNTVPYHGKSMKSKGG